MRVMGEHHHHHPKTSPSTLGLCRACDRSPWMPNPPDNLSRRHWAWRNPWNMLFRQRRIAMQTAGLLNSGVVHI